MPQRDRLMAWRRTMDNATIGLELAGWPQAARERAAPRWSALGWGGSRSPSLALSGGMRQRAAFLRTFLPGMPVMAAR